MHGGELHSQQSQSAAAQSVTPGASPYVYTAGRAGLLVVSGGTVSLLEYGRAGSFFLTGLLTGVISLVKGDSVRVTYVVAPTITFLPG
jgi:hypothetical protein